MDPAAMIAASAAPRSPAPPAREPDYPKGQGVEFPKPQDFIPPDVTKPGDTFQALGTFRIKDDNTMCLVAVDGSMVEPVKEKAPPATPPETMPEALKKGLPATGLPV